MEEQLEMVGIDLKFVALGVFHWEGTMSIMISYSPCEVC